MAYAPLRAPIAGRDENGRPVYRVPLASVDAHAIIYAEDLNALRSEGVSLNWCWHDNAVKVGHRPLNTQRVARLILKAPSGFAVRHKNRNGLDLRRDNLFMVPIKRHPKPSFTNNHRPL